MTTELDLIRAGVNGLGALDLDLVDDASLHELVLAVQHQRDRLAVAHARLLACWSERGTWAADGSRSAAHRLARETRCSVTAARRELHRGRDLAVMPAVAAAIAAGRLSIGHAELFATARSEGREEAFERDEAFLVDTCAGLSFADTVKALNYWSQRVDADGAERDAERARDRVHAHTGRCTDGRVVVDAVLDPVGGAAFADELDRLTRELHRTDRSGGVQRSARQRRAAALVEMAKRSAARAAGASPASPLFTVLVGEDSFRRVCELADGTVVTPGALVPWLNDSRFESILFDGASTVVSVSRQRLFTAAVRRAVQVRDRRCTHPSGCDVPAERCDVDHIVPVAVGGPTSQFNGRLRCATHNRTADWCGADRVVPRERALGRLDELRVRVRWRNRHHYPEPDEPDEPDELADPDLAGADGVRSAARPAARV